MYIDVVSYGYGNGFLGNENAMVVRTMESTGVFWISLIVVTAVYYTTCTGFEEVERQGQ